MQEAKSITKGPVKRLGDQLVDSGLITADQLKIALLEQKARGKHLGEILISLGFVTDEVVRDVLSSSLGQSSVDLKSVVVDTEVLDLLGQKTARQLKTIPLAFDEKTGRLEVAIEDTFDVITLDRIKALIGRRIEVVPKMAAAKQIEDALDRLYGFDLSIDSILQEIESEKKDFSDYHGEDEEYSHPMVRLVDSLLADAVKQQASDIHIEPEKGFLRIRYRIDGVMRQVRSIHAKYWPAINVRLKVMSQMNIAESQTPQDGRISRTIGSRDIDFRVATQPTLHGENIVLRVLDKNQGIVPLEKMSLPPVQLTTINLIMSRPEGIILVTGPTGSGKTTTLYSMLGALNEDSVNIMTLEDPVEYPISMIRQSSIGSAGKMSFAKGIRSLMRQDPDIILVGEIRDQETAEQAFRAAMTGHLVLSTLHTNSAIGAIPRLLDLGLAPFVMSSNVSGIIGQRLLRKLCTKCKEPYEPDSVEKNILGDQVGETKLYKPVGCKHCDQQGYKGRIPVLEVLKIDSEIDDLISKRASYLEIETLAISKGFETLADSAARLVIAGETSLDEAVRSIDMTGRL